MDGLRAVFRTSHWPDRRKARALTVMALYWQELNPAPWDTIVRELRTQYVKDAEASVWRRVNDLGRQVYAHREEFDRHIAGAAEHWSLQRISLITRMILYVALVELIQEALDPALVIHEAVEIAKTFAEDQAFRFVHGVLDGVKSQIQRVQS